MPGAPSNIDGLISFPLPTALRGNGDVRKRRASEVEPKTKCPTELTLLALLEHGSAKDMSIIKGLTSDDIKKVMASRKRGRGMAGDLQTLPAVLQRKISIRQLIAENGVA
ncbi:unnamed protein product [Durusdinium trenchii]|uniref:Uncharacterized protein n=1 Tax=Durusdinium trenchii TaxID=1381693 RepID=A0ABP0KTJ0_9DINO